MAPHVVPSEVRLAVLSEAKRALLEHRSRASDGIPILPRDGRGLPLSPGQQRLWLLNQLMPDLSAYNVVQASQLSGSLDAGALSSALADVVARHEVLRTRIHLVNGRPVAVVGESDPTPLAVEDLRQIAADTDDLLAVEARQPFALERDPPIRSRLWRITDSEWLLSVVLHHVVSDSTSRNVLLTELATAYAARVGGRATNLPELPVQYADWAAWQLTTLDSPEMAGALDWWRRQLAGAPAELGLPTDRAHPARPDLQGARHVDVVGAAQAAAVRDLARRRGATLFQVVLAGLAGLLARYGAGDDLVIGVPVTNRARPEVAGLVGFFSNLVPVRLHVGGDPTVDELMARARAAAVETLAHAGVPFEHLVAEFSPDRGLDRTPLFQVALSVETAAEVVLQLPDVTVTEVDVPPAQAKFELALSVVDHGPHGLRLEWEYRTALYDAETVVRMSRHLRRLLGQAAAAPHERLSRLELLDARDRAELFGWGSNGSIPEPSGELEPLPTRVARMAAARPEATAVIGPDRRFSYDQVMDASGRLAQRLGQLGIGPGARVAVCLKRSAWLVPALLGILRGGAAYVPVDPVYPAERVRFMLTDAGCAALVTTADLARTLPDTGVPVILADLPLPAPAGPFTPADPPTSTPLPEDLAYVIYTSGSTGRPKGVMVEHRALSALLLAMGREPGLSAADTLLAVTTPSFDIAALELFLPLYVGGRVVVAAQSDTVDPERLADLLDTHAVTAMQATPATWQMLVTGGWAGRAGLKMMCGGETLPVPLAAQLLRRGGQLWNMYGPTETTIWSLTQQVGSPAEAASIGRPIPGTQVRVVDRYGGLAPVGVIGELLIGGQGLARGYLGRPDLTAERFQTPAVAGGQRVYRTGDLVRWRADGRLEFHGRSDQQVKLRGFRIELGEVEAALLGEPGVQEAAVVLTADRSQEPQLAAYVVGGPSSPELRRRLTERLPGYMVPAAFVAMPALPRTPSGKVDRAALPLPQAAAGSRPGNGQVPPRTPVEELLAELWAEVLDVAGVGAHDDFFSLGGHSLQLLQVAARLRQKVGVTLPLRDAYEHSTLAGMAVVVAGELLGSIEPDLMLADPRGGLRP